MDDQNHNDPIKHFLSIGEASEYLGVSIDTLRRWTRAGKITDTRSPGGHRYFKKTDLDGLFDSKYERYNEPNPKEEVEEQNESKAEVIVETRPQPKVIAEEIIIEKIVEVQSNENFFLEERDIRPTRDITVPQAIPLSIKSFQDDFAKRDFNSETRQEKTQILFSASSQTMVNGSGNTGSVNTNLLIPKIVNNEFVFEENSKVKKQKMDVRKFKKVLLIVFGIFILADIFFIIFWYSSPKMLSPLQ